MADAPKKQSWIVNQVGFWPLIGITAAFVGWGAYELFFSASTHPEWHFSKEDRKKTIMNPIKAVKHGEDFSNHPMQKGPDVVHQLNPYPSTKDFEVVKPVEKTK